MKEKVITIKPKGISQKQYSSFLLELNLMKKAWKPYGVNVEIIYNDGLYSLVPVTKQMLADMMLFSQLNFFDLCDVLRLKLTTYHDAPFNRHVMNDGSGDFFGCIQRD
jgi:hypothetical protein